MMRIRSKIRSRIREIERRSLRFFGCLSNRDSEYEFAYWQVAGDNLEILDIGACESLLPMKFARDGHHVTVCDIREYPERHPNLVSIRGDFIECQLPEKAFDYVLLISTIEHIGFGSYGAPVYKDGDFLAMEKAKRVIKPTGRIVLTFPFASKENIVSRFERWYDIARVKRLFEGMHVLAETYFIPHTKIFGRIVKWVPATLEQINSVDDVVNKYGYQCNAYYTVSLSPRQNFI